MFYFYFYLLPCTVLWNKYSANSLVSSLFVCTVQQLSTGNMDVPFVCLTEALFVCPAGTTSEEGVIFVYAIFNKPVSAVESTVYITAIFKQHALQVLHKYLPMYRDADRRDMLAQVRAVISQSHLTGIEGHWPLLLWLLPKQDQAQQNLH